MSETLTEQPETQPEEKRKAGRPRKIAPWFAAVARTMRDGTTLEMALMWNRITLDKAERRKLYRNREFRKLYRIERQLYMLNEYGKRPLTEMERIRKNLEKQIR
jgi:hypothetical protein